MRLKPQLGLPVPFYTIIRSLMILIIVVVSAENIYDYNDWFNDDDWFYEYPLVGLPSSVVMYESCREFVHALNDTRTKMKTSAGKCGLNNNDITNLTIPI